MLSCATTEICSKNVQKNLRSLAALVFRTLASTTTDATCALGLVARATIEKAAVVSWAYPNGSGMVCVVGALHKPRPPTCCADLRDVRQQHA